MGRSVDLGYWAAKVWKVDRPKGANPMPILMQSGVGDVPRRLTCAKYDRCLDYAADRHWKSFGCDACDVKQEVSRSQLESDVEPITRLIAAVTGDGKRRVVMPKRGVPKSVKLAVLPPEVERVE